MIAVPVTRHTVALSSAFALLLLAVSSPVFAQAGNLPYQPGAGVGISYGARQAILNSRLLGIRPKNLVRGADGSLLDVSRRGSQVFLRSPVTGDFQPGANPRRGWATGMGTGLGWSSVGGSYGSGPSNRYDAGGFSAASMMQWISMLDYGAGRYGSLSPAGAVTPLDQWIGQADWG